MPSELPVSPVLVQWITRDYEEHSGLRLTPQQAHRRWGLDSHSRSSDGSCVGNQYQNCRRFVMFSSRRSRDFVSRVSADWSRF